MKYPLTLLLEKTKTTKEFFQTVCVFVLGMCGVVGGGAVLIAQNAGGRSIQGGRNQNGGRYNRRNQGRQHFIR